MKNPILIIASSILLVSCGGEKDNNDKAYADSAAITPVVIKDTLEPSTVDGFEQFKFDMLVINLPSPMEVLNDLNKSKIEFNSALVVDNKKYQSAASDNQMQALFMGLYSIDMSYCIDYNKNTEALGYMASLKKLSDELGISKYYDKTFYDRFNNNMGKKDSLMNLINVATSLTDKYCRDNDKLKTSLLMFAGSWIEGVHFAAQAAGAAEQNESNKAVYERIWQQRLTTKNFQEAIEDYKKENYFKDIYPVLKEVEQIVVKAENVSDLKQAQVSMIADKISRLRKSLFEK